MGGKATGVGRGIGSSKKLIANRNLYQHLPPKMKSKLFCLLVCSYGISNECRGDGIERRNEVAYLLNPAMS